MYALLAFKVGVMCALLVHSADAFGSFVSDELKCDLLSGKGRALTGSGYENVGGPCLEKRDLNYARALEFLSTSYKTFTLYREESEEATEEYEAATEEYEAAKAKYEEAKAKRDELVKVTEENRKQYEDNRQEVEQAKADLKEAVEAALCLIARSSAEQARENWRFFTEEYYNFCLHPHLGEHPSEANNWTGSSYWSPIQCQQHRDKFDAEQAESKAARDQALKDLIEQYTGTLDDTDWQKYVDSDTCSSSEENWTLQL
eukprot:CAMPEP_0119353062 /NCGR_PEP_ID=MMETSP1334-20130426/2280_1 /TAXON_ID=127549 /ORGANISM="Calcidiscus leptoporus, Strain RCC1130" /LENGTH=258 /DNA_ID=CAMNT_0007366261 /DNA_START=29 /DNA_END=805 /DNA_ORIENTATION=-